MISETPSSAFQHDPLPDSSTHFRLLHILRGDFGQHVECEISSWPIDDAPSYYAISYTWGDPADTAKITVNGKPLAVRRNCEYVLQQAFATKASRYYWVDAICIAQTSIQERNHQVGIMGMIYSGAKHVFACVGPHADDSEYLMATVGRQRPILEKINKWGKSVKSYGMIDLFYNAPYPFIEGQRRAWRWLRCLFTMHTSEQLRTSKAFLSFTTRPYFTRVWVLQELHLATRLSYCCGADVQPGGYIRALEPLVEYWIDDHQGAYLHRKLKRSRKWILQKRARVNSPSKESWPDLQGFYWQGKTAGTCLRLGVSAQKQDFDAMLMVIRDFCCVDTRDNLYGILSLVKWPQGQGPTPDYTKDQFEVAKHVLSLWYQKHCFHLSFKEQCFELFSIFDVTLELPSLRHAITLRSSVITQADLRLQENHAPKIDKVQAEWRGIQISDGNPISKHVGSRRQSNLDSCYIEQVPNRRFVLIRIRSRITIRAHVDTKVGDWCLVEDPSPFRNGSCGLILRKLDGHKYVVVGSALIDNKDNGSVYDLEKEKSRFSRFKGWLDPEDLMVLAWMLDGVEGKEDVSDKDIEKFVSMRICGWTNSSYFEKVVKDI